MEREGRLDCRLPVYRGPGPSSFSKGGKVENGPALFARRRGGFDLAGG